ncbi:MAG: NUDIX domain-containing protein [Nocardioidaceae bacterium]|nr:NUDIX domain-containing protein [Nocardioidaceae bacterium]NUS51064.1 NUDIX domain-containing protein [Nocardioidaceae bacterium]
MTSRIDCVGGIVLDGSGRLLLVRRGREPAKGRWSIPGGRVEPGESDVEATTREVLEETALPVDVGTLAGSVERDAPGGAVYVIRDYRCTLGSGADPAAVRAGDDAADADWFSPEQVRVLDTSPGLVESLTEWGVL